MWTKSNELRWRRQQLAAVRANAQKAIEVKSVPKNFHDALEQEFSELNVARRKCGLEPIERTDSI